MKCPSCKNHSLVMSERSGVEIDYCPECRGIWLDRGELDKIIQKNSAVEPAPQRESHSGHYQKPYKRKKSFLEEIFD